MVSPRRRIISGRKFNPYVVGVFSLSPRLISLPLKSLSLWKSAGLWLFTCEPCMWWSDELRGNLWCLLKRRCVILTQCNSNKIVLTLESNGHGQNALLHSSTYAPAVNSKLKNNGKFSQKNMNFLCVYKTLLNVLSACKVL